MLNLKRQKSMRFGDQDRSWMGMGSDPDSFPGERVGKREHKRKQVPARFSEGPPSPPSSKRSRKLKASE
ncbi:hypothetical protein KP509_1Z081800 [Ceratopteris richardii]|nr:hypothetical protein KP509_1Z081800 [Ceratopteris richardii]